MQNLFAALQEVYFFNPKDPKVKKKHIQKHLLFISGFSILFKATAYSTVPTPLDCQSLHSNSQHFPKVAQNFWTWSSQIKAAFFLERP